MKKFTHKYRSDGFGSHFKTIIFAILFCKLKGYKYVYRPLTEVAHNYDNDPLFLEKLENLMNIKPFYDSIIDFPKHEIINGKDVIKHIKKHPDVISKENLQVIRDMFWKNKERKPNKNYIVAVHIRKKNQHDIGNLTKELPLKSYVNKINELRILYPNAIFNVYSQGNKEEFAQFFANDIILHLDEPLVDTFMGMVSADVFIAHYSTLSYVAALINDGTVHFKQCELTPCSHWLLW
tara:strand:+ start:479 stop:1186 length:708 start_codon:yes stop_codon:yes gene_type:complete